ncbi:MAG: TIGR01777 family oxidoreductase [Planctomycetota bacterium]
MNRYVAATTLPVSDEEAFAYHERHGALARLVPPWQNVVVESSDNSLKVGSKVVLKLKLGPIGLRWRAEHTGYDPPRSFEDIQVSGPFKSWQHRHVFEESGDERCVLRDDISYQVPLGGLGRLLAGPKVRRDLESMFAYRHRVTRDDLKDADEYGLKPLRVAISGSSGLLGGRLAAFLTLLGHEVISLERSIEKAAAKTNAVAPWASEDEAAKLNGVDAVIHLAGKTIASGRWNAKVKQQIRDSRVELTTQLSQRLASLSSPPSVFICASATGLYGDCGARELNERSEPGNDFLSGVAVEWEQSCEAAKYAGIRTVHARFGIILDPNGGALQKMLLPAKMLGGALGSGRQWWSWISIDDAVGAIYHAMARENVAGPMNVVAPNPLTNADFAKTLGRVLSRPAIFPAPAFALRLALGEMADALLLASTRVTPSVLQSTEYQFRFATAESALRYCLGKDRLESIE